jgi:hypothetical protein
MKIYDALELLGVISVISVTLALSVGMFVMIYVLWGDLHTRQPSIRYVLMKEYNRPNDDIPVCKSISCENGEWKFDKRSAR